MQEGISIIYRSNGCPLQMALLTVVNLSNTFQTNIALLFMITILHVQRSFPLL